MHHQSNRLLGQQQSQTAHSYAPRSGMSDTPSEPERKCNTNVLSHPHAILCSTSRTASHSIRAWRHPSHLFVLTPCPFPTSALTACYSMIPPGLALYPIPMISAFPLFSSLFFSTSSPPCRIDRSTNLACIGSAICRFSPPFLFLDSARCGLRAETSVEVQVQRLGLWLRPRYGAW